MAQKRQNSRHLDKRSEIYSRYVICSCPEPHVYNTEKCRGIDANYTIEKLRELVSDSVTNDQVPRISQLLCDYLSVIGDEGYVSFD